jgi:hypothetical protein
LELDDAMRARKSNRPVLALDLRTGQAKTYPALTEASDATGCLKAGVRAACRDEAKVPMSGYIFRYADQPHRLPRFTELQLRYFNQLGWPQRIIKGAYGLWVDGTMTGIATADELAKLSGILPGSVHNSFVKGRPVVGYELTHISPFGE